MDRIVRRPAQGWPQHGSVKGWSQALAAVLVLTRRRGL